MASCVYKPTIIKNGKEIESRLFNDLLSLTGNRESTKYLWGLSKIEDFTNSLTGLEYDENGEITIESYDKALNIKEIIEGKTTFLTEKRSLGAINNNNEVIRYQAVEPIIDKVLDFNKTNPSLVASISRDGNSYVINVDAKTFDNMEVPNDLMFSNSLNNQLRGLMRTLGFDVEIKDNLTYDGIFNPLTGKETAEGLRTVIQIAKGEVGETAFPEEFSHFMIEGLINEPLVQRVLNSLNNEDVIRSVLGDNFDEYYSLYNGDITMLQKEAAGKLLQDNITKQNTSTISQTLIGRLWGWIRNKFSKLNQSSIDKAIDDANKNIERLVPSIIDGSILPLFNKSLLQDSKPLYKVAKDVNKLQEVAEQALKLYAKRLKIVQSRTKSGKYSDKDLHTIKKLQKLNEEKKYAKSSLAFLTDSLSEIELLQKSINDLSLENMEEITELTKISNISKTLRRIKEFADAYSPIISTMTTINSLREQGEVELSEEDAVSIEQLAMRITTILNNINNVYKDLRFNTVFNFLQQYWGEDKIVTLGKNKGNQETLEMILTQAYKDIGGLDRWVSSMSDASDPLLSLIDKVVKVSQSNRDRILEEILFGIRSAHISLIKSGYNTDFMYEKDENNKPTGRLISDINFAKFNKERDAYIKELKDQGLDNYIIRSKVEAWERRRTESVIIDKTVGRVEILPAKSIYGIDRISKLAPAQKEYYDKMISLKASMDALIPARYANTYNAVQIRNDLIEGMSNNILDPKKSAKLAIESFKDKFLMRSDDDEFGQPVKNVENFEDWVVKNKIDISTSELKAKATDKYNKYLKSSHKQIMTDFANKRVEQLPVYYTRPLEDMDRLSMDFTSSMLAYSNMAVNYHEMNKIIDVMELTRDLVKERKVEQMSGGRQLVESFKVAHKFYSTPFTKQGSETNIGGRIDDYYASVFYGRKKLDEGSIKVFGQDVSVTKAADALKSYTSQIGLGLNLFSAISNATIGKMQMFIEGVSGEYYNLKDSAIAKKNYYALLPQYMGEINSITKNGKLGLLIDKFDALEEFNKDLKNKDFYKSPLSRILGSANFMFLNSAGEHYLHSRNMLAMLNATKIQDNNGKIVSLYDSFTTFEQKDLKGNSLGSILLLKDGSKTENGKLLFSTTLYQELDALQDKSENESLSPSELERMSELEEIKQFTHDYTNALKLRINKVSQSLNGAFNDTDKGAIHKYALGRLAIQFRQWMPGHYYRRLAKPYYDAQLDQWREGYYRTLGRFTWNLMKDIKHAQFHLATNWDQLTNHEKANIKRSITELIMFGVLSGLIGMMGPEKDRKGVWADRMVLYQLKRLKLEMSASIPIHPEMLNNLWTMLQSPSASINSFNNLINLFQFQTMFNEIESGRYKGWSEYSRNSLRAIPYMNQIIKVKDITTEDYMFSIYN